MFLCKTFLRCVLNLWKFNSFIESIVMQVDSLFQSDLLAKHLIYFFSFYTVSDIWFSHVT